jgi:hypothetical protein
MRGASHFGAALLCLVGAALLAVLGLARNGGAQVGDRPMTSPPRREAGPVTKQPWIGEACKEDFSTLCANLPNDSQRDTIVQCLKAHQETLSDGCAAAIAERREQGEGIRQGGRPGGRHGRRTGAESGDEAR